MSEEKKDEVLGQEKELDESELEAVSGGKGSCFDVDNVGNNPRLWRDERDKPSINPSNIPSYKPSDKSSYKPSSSF